MKHSDSRHISELLLWGTPLLLIIPNIWLDLTESYSCAEKAANILLPLGIYFILLAAWRRNAVTTLCLIPVMVLCAFQIVLLFLYGESIIAIDMFLNVLTTNAHEATELLRNLSVAIAVVCLIYIPPITIAVIGVIKKHELRQRQRHAGLVTGAAITAAGAATCLLCIFQPGGYAPQRRLFPVNVTSNIITAAERTMLSDNYFSTSDSFTFDAVDTRPDEGPEVYLLVIGETARADNWEINGYSRPTNPRLSRRSGLISYPKALSESNTTHKSVPLLMSHLDAASFGDSIYQVRSIIDAFGEAGYTTLWISDQQRNGSLIDFFGSRADHAHFLTDDKLGHQDMELCGYLRDELDSLAGRKLFIVLHTYGSHFNYKERYSPPYAIFGPEESAEASVGNRPGLINAYDNTIVYTDAVLDSIMSTLEQTGLPAAMLYLSDHGEDIFDDYRHRFLHASPTPTYWQIHVPMLIWMSESYRRLHPDEYAAAKANQNRDVSSSRSAFHTMAEIAGLRTRVLDRSASLASSSYSPGPRLYLNDYNEGIPLRESGMKASDFRQLESLGIAR